MSGTARILCSDSFLVSLTTAVDLLLLGLRFIAVDMTATRGYPIAALSPMLLRARGVHCSYMHVTADGSLT